jgi:predicted RND superfamily exporter protein
MKSIAVPACITSVMMAVGFAAFASSAIGPIARFGLYSAIGVVYCLAWTLVVTPAILSIFGNRLQVSRALVDCDLGVKFLPQLSKPLISLLVIVVTVIAMSSGVFKLVVHDSWTDAFPEHSNVKQAARIVDSRLGGANALYLFLAPEVAKLSDEKIKGFSLLDPKTMSSIDRFEREVKCLPGVGALLGPAGHVKSSRFVYSGFREEFREIPNSSVGIVEIIESIDMVRGPDRRREIINDDMKRAAIVVLVRNAEFARTHALIEAIQQLEVKWLRPVGYRIVFGGELALSQAMISHIVRSQMRSGIWAVIGLVCIVWVLTRSLVVAVVAIFPSCVSVLCVLGLMGHLKLSIGVATSMMCAMALGIGSDFTLYLLHRLQGNEQTEASWSVRCNKIRITQAIRESGGAIISSSVSVGIGFLTLLVSAMPINVLLGAIVAFAVCMCAMVSLYAVPACLLLINSTSVSEESL